MIFETHAHYDDNRFKDDRDETIKRVHEKGVAPIINVGGFYWFYHDYNGARKEI